MNVQTNVLDITRELQRKKLLKYKNLLSKKQRHMRSKGNCNRNKK